MVFELVVQGAGVTLVDSTALNEVAYLCADTLAPWQGGRVCDVPMSYGMVKTCKNHRKTMGK